MPYLNLPCLKPVKATILTVLAGLVACSSPTTNENPESAAIPMEESGSTFYVGTYAAADSNSVFLYSLNTETGELEKLSSFKAGGNPSYLALDGTGEHLYAVNETGDYEGKNSGAVSSFSVAKEDGNLTFLNRQPSLGGAPCYVAVQKEANTVLVANYTGGNVAALPVQENGELGQPNVVQHQGTGPNQDRQEAPHAHYISPSPDGRYSFAVDLGADKVFGYKVEAGKLEPNNPAVAYAAKAGSGPRHMAFHPEGQFAFLLHELNSTMTSLAYNADKGTFSEIQTITTLPADFKENNQPAAVKVSPDGKFLYGSNRGHNSLVVYSIDGNTGKLSLVQHVSTGGDWPRDFTIDPSGNILLVANERSNSITTFKVDKATGKLTATGYEAQVHKPVNILFR